MNGILYRAEWLHDGTRMLPGAALWVQGGTVAGLIAPGTPPPAGVRVIDLGAGGIAPGLVDLQVNGGGGAMTGDLRDAAGIAALCDTHARLGSTAILPTLITDTPATTRAVLDAGRAAARVGVAGFLGLHLEGPHLDPRRAGAHDPALIRPLTDADLALYLDAVADLPALMLTLAPEAARPEQIAALVRGGVIVSLGHSDCPAEAAQAALDAGARAVTHLFNAMSPLSHRAPGLVGAALDARVPAGLIADGVHVADAALRIALAASPSLFLVSDAMAVAGTDRDAFRLGGRIVRRGAGRLALEDGTLAGADVTLPQSVAHLVRLGLSAERALAMASSIPARLLGARAGWLHTGWQADFIHLDADFALRGIWRGGARLIGG